MLNKYFEGIVLKRHQIVSLSGILSCLNLSLEDEWDGEGIREELTSGYPWG